jgi:branched-chain amino acid transport system ATP-binding protein
MRSADPAVDAIRSGGAPMLKVTGGDLRFDRFQLFDDLSLSLGDLSAPAIVALIGTNGSGKSALANVISGNYRLSAGTVEIGGRDMTRMRPAARARNGVRRSFQNVSGIGGMTLLSYVTLGWEPVWPHSIASTVVGRLKAHRYERNIAEQTRSLIADVGLDEYYDRPLESCPYGVRKIADVVRAVGTAPGTVALLDEPTSGVSQSERGTVMDVIRRAFAENQCKLMVIIDHDVAFVRELCPSSVVLEAGKILAAGPTDEVLAMDRVAISFAGVSERHS